MMTDAEIREVWRLWSFGSSAGIATPDIIRLIDALIEERAKTLMWEYNHYERDLYGDSEKHRKWTLSDWISNERKRILGE